MKMHMYLRDVRRSNKFGRLLLVLKQDGKGRKPNVGLGKPRNGLMGTYLEKD